jgi:hypothetical protein
LRDTLGSTLIKAVNAATSRVTSGIRWRIARVQATKTSKIQRSKPSAAEQRELRQPERMFALLEKRSLVPAPGPCFNDLIAAQQFRHHRMEHPVPTVKPAQHQGVMRPVLQLDLPAMWAVGDGDLTGRQGASVVPHARDTFKAKVPNLIQNGSGDVTAVRQHPDLEALTNVVWDSLKHVQRQCNRARRVLALVHLGGDRKLDRAILGIQHNQMDTVKLGVDTPRWAACCPCSRCSSTRHWAAESGDACGVQPGVKIPIVLPWECPARSGVPVVLVE